MNYPALDNYEEIAYWLENDAYEYTSTFEVDALVWEPDDGQFLQFTGDLPEGVAATGKQVLINSRRQVSRVRFALPLAPNDHVIGFGERFHSIDQRGEFVDAVVYESTKGMDTVLTYQLPLGL